MSLEQQIVEWSTSRPPWQRAVLREVAMGNVLSDEYYAQLVETLALGKKVAEVHLTLDRLPQVSAGDPPVRLISIVHPDHVNAISSDRPLTFAANGVTIIYGDNASGKSGYARLLKRIARARHQEEVLTDVFRDSALAKPSAALTVTVGDQETPLAWPESNPPELKRMVFYDEACGKLYVDMEADFPYRPSALFVLDGLINACGAIRTRVDAKLEENSKLAKNLPFIDEQVKDTDAGRYMAQISATSSLEALDAILKKLDSPQASIEELKDEEARLLISDTTKERQKLSRQATKLESVRTQLTSNQDFLGDKGVATLQDERSQLRTIEQAALLVGSFASEPLHGVGTSPWKELWESARRFSVEQAYPGDSFPVITGDALCVLCQQPLKPAAIDRLSRFERFVQDDTQTKHRDAQAKWKKRVESLTTLRVTPEALEANLKDLETDLPELVQDVRALNARYEVARLKIVDTLAGTDELPRLGIDPTGVLARIQTAANAARTAAETLSDPEKTRKRLSAVTAQRKEMELLQQIKNERKVLTDEIDRLKVRATLEAIKNSAATGQITKKILDLSEESITEKVRDTFTRETDRLHLERVTLTRTRANKGLLLHQPKLVGARQDATLPRVLSEGEQTALGLAAFFTEVSLDTSKSALILDDPVCSLDHIRRSQVAARLAALAENRQVVVFTHDISFVADLKREAKGLGVSVSERSITKARGGEKKPGACDTGHPWKAKDVPERFDELRRELSQMKKSCQEWDDTCYENEVANWAGNLSETWERIFSQEIVGQVLAEGGLEVRPNMVRILTRFNEGDEGEFQASYSRISQWAKRHDKSVKVNYVAPEIGILEEELKRVEQWFKRVKGYKA